MNNDERSVKVRHIRRFFSLRSILFGNNGTIGSTTMTQEDPAVFELGTDYPADEESSRRGRDPLRILRDRPDGARLREETDIFEDRNCRDRSDVTVHIGTDKPPLITERGPVRFNASEKSIETKYHVRIVEAETKQCNPMVPLLSA